MKVPGGTARKSVVGLGALASVVLCRQHGVAFLDSTVPLRDAVAAGESVYLPDDVHWNAAGHRVVAAAVAAHLQQMGEPASIDAGNQR